MKLSDLLSQPLAEVLSSGDLELSEFKPYTNDKGDIKCVELKYVPKDTANSSGDILLPPPSFCSPKR